MDAKMRENRRQEVSQRRKSPTLPQRIYFTVAGQEECLEIEPNGAIELCIETTDAQGILVPWLTDEWWIRTHSVCKDRIVTVIILPTPGGVLDSVVIYQLEMVRRIAPKWRIIGYALGEDAGKEPQLDRWITTPYDEIRFCEKSACPSNNGISEAARVLVAQADELPRRNGTHRTLVRMVPSLPYQMSAPPSQLAPEHAETLKPSNTHRLTNENVVQST